MCEFTRTGETPSSASVHRIVRLFPRPPADPGHRLAAYLLDYLAGKKSDDQMVRYWDKAFPDANG